MALASLDDVNRVLRYTTGEDTTRDARVRAALAAIESRMEGQLKNIGREGSWVETFFDTYEDATLYLPAQDATVTLVKVFDYPSSEGTLLDWIGLGRGHGYDLTDEGAVILRPALFVEPFEGAIASRPLKVYSRVEVHYQGTGQIPKAVTEGIALLAAEYYKNAPLTVGRLKSEKIGDYQYTVAEDEAGEESDAFKRAMWFLHPYMGRKRRVLVT